MRRVNVLAHILANFLAAEFGEGIMKHILELLVLVGLMACALLWSAPVFGATSARFCGERTMVLNHILHIRRETLQSYGLAGTTAVVEIYASPIGTWSILATNTRGQTCVLGFGHGFETTPRAPGKPA